MPFSRRRWHHKRVRSLGNTPTIYITNPELVVETSQLALPHTDALQVDTPDNQLANILDTNILDTNILNVELALPPNPYEVEAVVTGCYCGCSIRSFLYHGFIAWSYQVPTTILTHLPILQSMQRPRRRRIG